MFISHSQMIADRPTLVDKLINVLSFIVPSIAKSVNKFFNILKLAFLPAVLLYIGFVLLVGSRKIRFAIIAT